MTDITYPSGCRPLSEDLGTDELIRRLKTLAHTLQAMDQDNNLFQPYIPLALHLVDDFFLSHTSRDVQLLVACCIADVLRIYAPEPPYKDQEQIKMIFTFFIKQLHGLKDPKDPSFKRYFYLLENLAYVKSFNMCFEIEDCQKIFCQLFSMMFRLINEEHSSKVKNFIIDILSPLIAEADNFSNELLDLILVNIVDPNKSQNKCAYQLAEQLIRKTSDSLEPIIKMFFNQVLVMDVVDNRLSISFKIYDLIYELNVISPDVLCSVLPQLECKFKSTNEAERLKAVALLARMFSEKGSQLAKKHSVLFRSFLGRFCDIAVAVRVKCVQSSMHFLLNHPPLRNDITECLRARQHDSDENVRYEVVMAIVETAKREYRIICESEDLLHIVRERTLDKKFKIRKEALTGLAVVYRQVWCEPNDLTDAVKKSIDWTKNKVMHAYYMPGIEDRLLVERLLITCLVPYKLPAEERMKKLYHLLGTMDENATKAFTELQKNQMKTRKTVYDWIKMHQTKEITPKIQNQLNIKQNLISRLLPNHIQASDYLTKFSQNLRKDPSLLRHMEAILKRDVSCRECADNMSSLLKKLGPPVQTNVYYNTVKMLAERIASVMVDKEAIGVLIGLVEVCLKRGKVVDEVGLSRGEAGYRGLQLLSVLSYVFSAHFFTASSLRHMIALLSYEEECVAPLILKCLTHLGRYSPLAEVNGDILAELAPICKEFALSGTPKQAKNAVRCIFVNSQSSAIAVDTAAASPVIHPIFVEILESIRTSLSQDCDQQRTKIVTLGHIAFYMPQAFLTPIKNVIARRIVKELLIQGVPQSRDCDLPEGDWCAEEDLPMDTLCKLDALKTMARWLLGLKSDEHAAQKTFRMLTAFINQRGDLLEDNRLCPAEKSWLRLGAACAILKVCEQKGVGDQYSAEQYFHLSQLMLDPVPEVRLYFARKLHKGLGKGLPNKCLPLDFMGFYALAGHETDKKLSDTIGHFVEADVVRRREYLKSISTVGCSDACSDTQSLHILPDFMLAFAIAVLVHDPAYTDHTDRSQLKKIEKCLRFVLDPLMAKQEAFSYSFYKNLIEKMKNSEMNETNSDGTSQNLKMWAACDLAMRIIISKIRQCDFSPKTNNGFSLSIELPTMYYKTPADENFQNTKIYIPIDMYTPGPSSAGMTAGKTLAASARASVATTGATKKAGRQHLSKGSLSEMVSEKRSARTGHISSNENSSRSSHEDDLYDGNDDDDGGNDDDDDDDDNDDDDDDDNIATSEPKTKRSRLAPRSVCKS